MIAKLRGTLDPTVVVAAMFGALALVANVHGGGGPDTGQTKTDGVPRIVATTPKIGETDVSPTLTEITVTFDRDMDKGFSWTGSGPEYPPLQDGKKPQWRDPRTCVLPVKLA